MHGKLNEFIDLEINIQITQNRKFIARFNLFPFHEKKKKCIHYIYILCNFTNSIRFFSPTFIILSAKIKTSLHSLFFGIHIFSELVAGK